MLEALELDDVRIEDRGGNRGFHANLALRIDDLDLGNHNALASLQDRCNHINVLIINIDGTKEIGIDGHADVLTAKGIRSTGTCDISQSKQEAAMNRAYVVSAIWARKSAKDIATLLGFKKNRAVETSDIDKVFFAVSFDNWMKHGFSVHGPSGEPRLARLGCSPIVSQNKTAQHDAAPNQVS